MREKNLFFLAGLPRSGSTVLASLLSSRSDMTVTTTSPFLDLLYYVDEAFGKLAQIYTFDRNTISANVFRGISANFYNHIETPYVIDKHRGHPRNLAPIKQYVTPDPKILCTYRPIPEIIASYVALMEKSPRGSNFVDRDLAQSGLAITTENRAMTLWTKHISDPYNSLLHGMRNHRKNLLLIAYDDLVGDPARTLNGIYDFLGIPRWESHQFHGIQAKGLEENDFAWGLEGLHHIRPILKKTSKSPIEVLGPDLASRFEQFNIDPDA